jgi:putative SOS response-associated peptidase YedK
VILKLCSRHYYSTRRRGGRKITKKFKVEEVPPLVERYNVAPAQAVLGIRELSSTREATFFKWGLVPSWAKDKAIGNKLINARSETVTEKPSFREAFARRRCLVPVDGFFEWSRRGDRKRPFYFPMRDGEPFAIAGPWERWEGEGGPLETCTLLTTSANELLAPYHDRMPVILRPEDYDVWLGAAGGGADRLTSLLCPYPHEEMTAYAVSPLVNSPSNDSQRCVEPITGATG